MYIAIYIEAPIFSKLRLFRPACENYWQDNHTILGKNIKLVGFSHRENNFLSSIWSILRVF